MKILLLGGTGAMGTHLVDLLNTSKNEVFVTSRRANKSCHNVQFITGNARENDFLTKLLVSKWDVIIDFMVYKTKEFSERVNLLLNSTSQYVFLSSSRVYADSQEPLKEVSPRLLDVSSDEEFLRTDEYSLTKARQENILRETGKNNWTIIRPYITYSSQRLQLGTLEKENWLYRALSGRTIVFSEDISNKTTTMTYGLDVARGIVSIIGKVEALGEVFHITSNKSHTWGDILDIYLKVLENHLGYKPKILFDNFENFNTYHHATYQIKYDRLFNRIFDNSKISNYIEVDSFTQAEEGLQECLEEFLRDPAPRFKTIDLRAEALKDRRTKEFTNLKAISGFKQKIKYVLYRIFIK